MQNAILHPETVADAAAILRGGGVCAFPTETVYGLGADATNAEAVLAIYETKGRPRFNPLIVHCADLAMVASLVDLPPEAEALASLWPGPLSLVLPKRRDADVADVVTAGLETLAVRIPAHPLARDLIAAVGKPLAAPSANPSGKLSPTSAEQVKVLFENKVPVFDGGPCANGLESTIITLTDGHPVQLRAGALSRSVIEAAIGRPVLRAATNSAIAAPGMLLNHYAPATLVRLNRDQPEAGEAYLAFGPAPECDGPMLNLSAAGDLREAARTLFACLHRLDATSSAAIAVAPIPDEGLGEAINDRLRRAAAPKIT